MRLIAVVLALLLLTLPGLRPVAEATVATGAFSTRSVFSLTASGAAKVAAAEASIATAVRILGMLGRFAGYVGIGIALVDIAVNTWDWWHQNYDSGAPGTAVPAGSGNWGVMGTGEGDGGTWCADGFSVAGSGLPAGYTAVGQRVVAYTQSYLAQQHGGTCWGRYIEMVNTTTLPTASVSSVPYGGQTNRDTFAADIDSAIAGLQAAKSAAVGGVAQQATTAYDALIGALQQARSYVSNGVALVTGDYTQGPGWANGSGSVAGNAPPASIPTGATGGGGETTSSPTGTGTGTGTQSVDLSPVTSAVSGVASAVQTAQAAIVSAVASATAAISASQAAVVSAVQAVAAPIVASVAASQAAVVSAVQAVAAPIVASVTGAKNDIVAAIQAQPSGGGGGATDAVNSLASQEAARDQAATTAETANPAPAVQCPVCTRVDKWQELWGTIRTAGMSAPIFLLLNNLVINPSGTVTRQSSASTSHFGTLSLSLTPWGVDTWIGVLRYAVLFTAVLMAYFVIFG